MKKYPAYKKGIYDWWEQVPSTWQEVSMKEVAVLSDERCGERQEELLSVYRELGVIRKNSRNDNHNVESEDLSNYKMVYPGYLVMNKMKMWQGSLGISDYQGIVSPAYIVCKLNGNFDSKYLHTLLRATPFKTYYNRVSRGIRVGQWDMSFSDFRSLKIFLPNLQEQQQIVRYIDWKTSQINHLIHGYERLISLLEERRISAVIYKVENGIRHHHEYKKSTYAWLEDYPVEWKEKKLKNIALKLNRQCTKDDELLVCSNSGKVVPRGDSKLGLIASSDDIYQGVHKGDLLIHGMDTWHGAIAVSELNGKCTPVVHVCDSKENKEYLAYYLRSLAYKNVYKKISNGVRENTSDFRSWDKAGSLPVILPSRDEQDEIVKSLNDMEKKVESLKGIYEKQIELLRERRTRLISDVVTGALDVRDVVVPEYALEQDMEVTEDGDEYEGERAGETDC